MAGNFTAASTQYLSNSAPPVLDYPLTVAFWFNLAAVGTVSRSLWGLSDTATTNNYLRIRMGANEQVNIGAAAGGAASENAVATTLVPDTWNFLIARFISATSRRLSILFPTGAIASVNGTTSTAPTGMDRMTFGANQTSAGATDPWDGLIAEAWYTNTDIQADGAAIQGDLMRQLAYGGPFSVPHIAADVLEYRSLRCGLASDQDNAEEVYAQARQTWSNVNGVTLGAHPPLPYWYEKPKAAAGLVMI